MKGKPLVYLILFIGMLMPTFVFSDTGSISRLVFTTDQRSVLPGHVSDVITVQTQDSSGESKSVSETNDVTFTSSSLTGEFLNGSGNPVSTTMNRNTSSRNFYYRDSSAGTHTITITIIGRESGKSFNVSQNVVVGTGASSGENSPNASKSNSVDNKLESHSSPSDSSSSKEPPSDLEISAGRDRLSSVGVPVEFDAFLTKPRNVDFDKVKFFWSFGDGTKVKGSSARHTYFFPGEYTVVLNSSYLGKEAVARIKVKIVESDISISKVNDDYIEIRNNGNFEENLGSFLLETDKVTFLIASDTIVLPGQDVKIPSAITGISGADSVFVKNPSGEIVALYETGMVAGDFNITFERVDINTIEKRLKGILDKGDGPPDLATAGEAAVARSGGPSLKNTDNIKDDDSQKDNSPEKDNNIVFTVKPEKEKSWLKKLLNWLF